MACLDSGGLAILLRGGCEHWDVVSAERGVSGLGPEPGRLVSMH